MHLFTELYDKIFFSVMKINCSSFILLLRSIELVLCFEVTSYYYFEVTANYMCS